MRAAWTLLVVVTLVVMAGSDIVTRPAVAIADTDAVTFTQHIAPLLQQHCQECHRPGQIAPFALLTWEQAYSRREKIRKMVTLKKMPPWKPVAGYGDFLDPRGLSPAEIALFERWAKSGGAEGDPSLLPPALEFSDAPVLGPPDLTLAAESYTVPAGTGDLCRCLVIPHVFGEERFITKMEFVPGNRKIVHHAIAYVDATGYSVELDRREPGPGYTCFGGPRFPAAGFAGGWTPRARPWTLPEGTGILLPRGARLVFQMHYHNDNAGPETDASAIRLYFAKGPIERPVHFARVIDLNLSIPAGAKRHQLDVTWPARDDLELIAIHPHMHLLGKEMEVWATQADGRRVPLIHIDDWDFDWQGFYFYRQPVRLTRGGRIDLKAVWDNSAENPRNPSHPPKPVRWGERTVDEMGHAAILYTYAEKR